MFSKKRLLLKKTSFEKNSLTILLTIVKKGSSLAIVNEGLSLTIVNETKNFIKTVVFRNTIVLEEKNYMQL